MKRQFLLWQINKHLATLKKQDFAFFKFGLHDIKGHMITDFARERGITTISCYEALKVLIADQWVTKCMKLSPNTMVWYAVMQYDFLQNANKELN